MTRYSSPKNGNTNKECTSQSPPTRSRRLASGLCRNSAYRSRHAALASLSDASGAIDKCPVLAQHAGQGALSTKSVLPEHGLLAQNLTTQLERYRVGKPSLFSEEKCLSLHKSILAQESKTGKEAALPPLAEAQRYPRRNRHEHFNAN
jgi:hypothetical protein